MIFRFPQRRLRSSFSRWSGTAVSEEPVESEAVVETASVVLTDRGGPGGGKRSWMGGDGHSVLPVAGPEVGRVEA